VRMRRLRPPPSEEIEAQEELLMIHNITMSKTDETFANENEVLDMNAAVKIKSQVGEQDGHGEDRGHLAERRERQDEQRHSC